MKMALASGPHWGQLWHLFNAARDEVKAAKDAQLYKHDRQLFAFGDLSAAMGLLTRFPVIVDTEKAVARGASAAWAFPIVGMVLGVWLAAVTALLTGAGVPLGITAALVVAVSVVSTVAMHEDGLSDTADGFWGGWDKARRLAIMKDSHIGVYGVCAIALSLLIRWLAFATIISAGNHWMAFIAVGGISRAAMVVVMAMLPHARDSGLSRNVGRPPTNTAWVTVGIGLIIAAACGFPALIVTGLFATAIVMTIARAKIGGQTGDVLGATQQVVEITCLITIATIMTYI